jgi:Raf kinase inhibitor-like YbhB/YbcL family protein
MRNYILRLLGLLVLSILPASALADTAKRTPRSPASLDVTSTAFKNNEVIPSEYTCDGTGGAPPLSWSNVPAGTKSTAILVDDPDAPKGTFTHWLVTGIPATATSTSGGLPSQAVESKNDKGTSGYTGPCPPSGRHHYQFHVYALDITLPKAMTRADFLNAISGHILATGQLVGTYQKHAGK